MMKFYNVTLIAIMASVLLSCATPYNVAAARKAHFKNLPQKNAALQSILNKREQADCDAQGENVTQDAQPLVRIPPYMPQGATTSGYCELKFDVNKKGQPLNIQTISCTDDIFDYASRKSISTWKYSPRIADGEAVSRCDIHNKMHFVLTNSRGKRI